MSAVIANAVNVAAMSHVLAAISTATFWRHSCKETSVSHALAVTWGQIFAVISFQVLQTTHLAVKLWLLLRLGSPCISRRQMLLTD